MDAATCPKQGQQLGVQLESAFSTDFEIIDEGVSLLDDSNETQSQKLVGVFLVFAVACCIDDIEDIIYLHATEKKMSCIPFFFAEKHHSRLSLHKQSQEPRSSDVPPEGAADERPALDPPTSAASTMSPQVRHSTTSHKQTLQF